jgi:hypothetical protein
LARSITSSRVNERAGAQDEQFLPRGPLRRLPRRALSWGPSCARERVLHPARVERRAPAPLVVARELKVVVWVRHADGDRPIPAQESSQIRSAQSARSCEGRDRPAKPSAATSSRGALVHAIRSGAPSAGAAAGASMIGSGNVSWRRAFDLDGVVAKEHDRAPFRRGIEGLPT